VQRGTVESTDPASAGSCVPHPEEDQAARAAGREAVSKTGRMGDAEDVPPAGPSGSPAGAGAAPPPAPQRHGSAPADALGLPNLCDLEGRLRVTVAGVRHIPAVPAQSAPTTGRRVPRVRGQPFLKLQIGLHQFQTSEPTLAAADDAVPSDERELLWGETMVFELSGDMRELRVSLMNWARPFADGPQGVVRIPVSELVHRKWANTRRTVPKFFVTGIDEEPLKRSKDQHTSLELEVVYEPGPSLFSGQSAAADEPRALHTGVMMSCELCRRRVFVTTRPTPSLIKKERKIKSQRKILLWLRDYNFHDAIDVEKFEVPCSQFALPSFFFGPDAGATAPLRDFVSVITQDHKLKKVLREIRVLNHMRRLNTWTPVYCSCAEKEGDGLVEAVSVAVWGIQDMASRLDAEIRQELHEKHDRYLHLWRKAHYSWYPQHGEDDARQTWQRINDEITHGHTVSREARLLRILVLANVINRPLVVHSDESFPTRQEEKSPHSIAVFGVPSSGAAVEPGPLRGIYLPLLRAKPLLLESNRCNYRPPIPLVFSTETQLFQPLAAQEGEESDLFEILPWPPLLPLFVGQRLLPLPFTLVDTETEEGTQKAEKFVHKFIICQDTAQSREMVMPFGVPAGGKLRHSEKMRCVALAQLDTAQCPPTFFPLLKRYLLLADHYHVTAELHEGQELSSIEMAEYVAAERPWQQLPNSAHAGAVRDTYAHGKRAEKHEAAACASARLEVEEQVMTLFFHECVRAASCVRPDDIDSCLQTIDELEKIARCGGGQSRIVTSPSHRESK